MARRAPYFTRTLRGPEMKRRSMTMLAPATIEFPSTSVISAGGASSSVAAL
jgi:hypothetical protein